MIWMLVTLAWLSGFLFLWALVFVGGQSEAPLELEPVLQTTPQRLTEPSTRAISYAQSLHTSR